MGEKLYTVKELAEKWDVADITIRRYIKSGKLNAYDLGSGYRISETQAEEFLQNRQTKQRRDHSDE